MNVRNWILAAALASLVLVGCDDDGGGSEGATTDTASDTITQDTSGDGATGPSEEDTEDEGPTCDDGAPAALGGSFTGSFTDDDGNSFALDGGAEFGFVEDDTGGSDGDQAFAVRMLSGACDDRTEVVLTIYTSSLPEEKVYENSEGALTSNVRVDLSTKATTAYLSTFGEGGTGATAEITSAGDSEVSGTFELVRDNAQSVSGSFTAVKSDGLDFEFL
ncbi:MAG: hypothetical protein ACQEXJ_19895 [Myxococcota bacterium]